MFWPSWVSDWDENDIKAEPGHASHTWISKECDLRLQTTERFCTFITVCTDVLINTCSYYHLHDSFWKTLAVFGILFRSCSSMEHFKPFLLWLRMVSCTLWSLPKGHRFSHRSVHYMTCRRNYRTNYCFSYYSKTWWTLPKIDSFYQ